MQLPKPRQVSVQFVRVACSRDHTHQVRTTWNREARPRFPAYKSSVLVSEYVPQVAFTDLPHPANVDAVSHHRAEPIGLKRIPRNELHRRSCYLFNLYLLAFNP